MKKLLLTLVPLALSAQVAVDTVIGGLPSVLRESYFMPELNKLYIRGNGQFVVLDCSTYQARALPVSMGSDSYAWNWCRQKLYVNCNPHPDSTYVIDAVADSIIGWLTYQVDPVRQVRCLTVHSSGRKEDPSRGACERPGVKLTKGPLMRSTPWVSRSMRATTALG